MDKTRITASIDTISLLFISCSSHLEVIPDGDNSANRADQYADGKEGYKYKGPHLREGHDLHEGDTEAFDDLCLKRGIQTPLSKKRQSAADHAENKSFNNKRAANKAVGSADHLHYGDLLASAVSGKLDSVAHYKQRYKAEYDYQRKGHDAYDVPDRYELIRKLGGGIDLDDAVDILDLSFCLIHKAEVDELDGKTVAEHLVVYSLHEALVILLHEAFPCLASADKFNACHIVQRLKLGLELRGGLLRGHILINISKDLVLVAYIVNYLIDIDIQQSEAAHNDQAGDYYRNRCEGHKAMRKNIAEALAYKISVSIQLHSCNTRPFRH